MRAILTLVFLLLADTALAQTRYYSIAGTGMNPTNSRGGEVAKAAYSGAASGAYRSPTVLPPMEGRRESLQATVNLPQEATVTSFTCSMRDPDVTSALNIQLISYSRTGGSSMMAVLRTTADQVGNYTLTTNAIAVPVVNNFRNAYSIHMYSPRTCTDCRLYSCKIGYTR